MSKKKNAGGPRGNGRAQLLVVPGEDLGDSDGMEAGHGVLPISGRLRAVKQGRVRNQGSTISVEPVHTRFLYVSWARRCV